MIRPLDNENLVDNVFASYEARIRSVECFLETARSVLESFEESLLRVRGDYEQISEQLRDTLAKNGSLRKKDFDGMIGVVMADQDRRGQEVRDLSRRYLDEQTQLTHELHGRLRGFTSALAEGEAAKVTEHHQAITDLFAKQQRHGEDVVTRLKESQKAQQETAGMLKGLLAKGRELRIRDFKSMLAEFKRQRDQRLIEQDQRREEVQDMLRESRTRRVEAEQDRRRRAEDRGRKAEDEATWQERVDEQVEEMEAGLRRRSQQNELTRCGSCSQ